MNLLLRTIYGNPSWHRKIEQNEYILESKDSTKQLESRNWDDLIKSEDTIYMTMLIKHRDTINDTSCRQCCAINIEKVSGNAKMKWYISPPIQ